MTEDIWLGIISAVGFATFAFLTGLTIVVTCLIYASKIQNREADTFNAKARLVESLKENKED